MRFKNRLLQILLFGFLAVLGNSCNSPNSKPRDNIYLSGLEKLEYNNPGLIVDLDAGFKAVPLPVDFDGDGDYDLLISESGSYTESGVFYFENISGNVDMPIFRYGMQVSTERFRLGYDGSTFEMSDVNGQFHVLTPDRVAERLLIYKNIPQNVFWDRNEIRLPAGGYNYLHTFKYTLWKMIDFDGDGTCDLICAAQSPRPPGLRGTGAAIRYKSYNAASKAPQLLFLRNNGTDEKPLYEDPEIIALESGESLAEGLSIRPMFADYDNDGDLDFISIRRRDDCFIYYENRGTKYEHKFAGGRVLFHEDKPVKMVSRATIHSTAVDWNKDGFIDIIAGDEDGKISFLKNSGRSADGLPDFLPPRFFQQEAKFVDFGALVAPRIFDWDGDGLDDIISGNGVGSIGFIRNLGGDLPRWAAPELLKADGKEIRILPEEADWGYTTIDVGDWNHDNLPDIVVNHHHGNVLWYENAGTRNRPALLEAKPVEVNWEGEPQKPDWVPGKVEGNELLAPWRTSPLIMDYNNDGLNDLVMLDYEGYLVVYPRYRESTGELVLSQPLRNFIFESGEPVLLNQLTGSSSGRLKITFADWDGDGLEDLIVSSKPAVDWMKNIGKRGDKMVLQYMGRVASRRLMGHTDGPVVSDFNNDGILDLLVGTETGVFYYWERSSSAITTTMTTTGSQSPANYKYFKR